jgi:hypothetical protein
VRSNSRAKSLMEYVVAMFALFTFT